MESTIGRLNHAGHILPMARYFLTRLRYRLKMCKEWGKQKLADWDRADLELWLKILKQATQVGVSINNITFTTPTHIGTTDACETGMEGVSGKRTSMALPTSSEAPRSFHNKPLGIHGRNYQHMVDALGIRW